MTNSQKGGPDATRMGVVARYPLLGAGGSTCHYCGEIDGHTGQCPVVSVVSP